MKCHQLQGDAVYFWSGALSLYPTEGVALRLLSQDRANRAHHKRKHSTNCRFTSTALGESLGECSLAQNSATWHRILILSRAPEFLVTPQCNFLWHINVIVGLHITKSCKLNCDYHRSMSRCSILPSLTTGQRVLPFQVYTIEWESFKRILFLS